MLKEFKAFALRGNVVDLAVAFIMGAAFGQITTSLVNDIVMPPLGLVIGQLDFSQLFINLSRDANYASVAEARAAGAPVIAYGAFVNTVINFAIIALVMFVIVRQINHVRSQVDAGEAPPPIPETKACPYCVSTIPLAASRCPQCTSDLGESVAGPGEPR